MVLLSTERDDIGPVAASLGCDMPPLEPLVRTVLRKAKVRGREEVGAEVGGMAVQVKNCLESLGAACRSKGSDWKTEGMMI